MTDNEIQDYVNNLAEIGKQERSVSQMTLGKLISRIEKMTLDYFPVGLSSPDSYRGYYSDLAFEFTDKPMKREDVLKVCYSALNETFYGYKGGDYVMDSNTPVWIAEYGSCGVKIIFVKEDGSFVTENDE